VIGFLAIVPCF